MDAAALQRLWVEHRAAAALAEDEATIGALIAAHAETHRRYHGLSHLAFLFREEAAQYARLENAALVRFAIWFHDAVYDPAAKDNEEQSAAWAARALRDAPTLAEAVAALILKTKAHAVGAASADEALFLDMDIAILGAPAPLYAAYAAGVRQEYAIYPDAAWRAGRSAFLQSQIGLDRLFRTDIYHDFYGAQAKANMAWELEELAAGRIPG